MLRLAMLALVALATALPHADTDGSSVAALNAKKDIEIAATADHLETTPNDTASLLQPDEAVQAWGHRHRPHRHHPHHPHRPHRHHPHHPHNPHRHHPHHPHSPHSHSPHTHAPSSCNGLDWTQFFPTGSTLQQISEFAMDGMGTFDIKNVGDCAPDGSASVSGHTGFSIGNGKVSGNLGFKITTPPAGGAIASLYAQDVKFNNLKFLGWNVNFKTDLYLIGFRYKSGDDKKGDYLTIFFQVHLDKLSIGEILTGVLRSIHPGAGFSFDFLPSFTNVKITACTGTSEKSTEDNLAAQSGGKDWKSDNYMGQALTLGRKTLDLKSYHTDGVYAEADLDIAPGTSLIAQVLRFLICLLPNLLVGSCNTVWQVSAFAPMDGDFDKAYVKAKQSAEYYGSERFITHVGDRSLEVVGFGSGGIQSAVAEVKNIDLSFPTKFGFKACPGKFLCSYKHLVTITAKAGYYNDGLQNGKRIQLTLALPYLNWVNPFGINGITINTVSASFIFIWSAAQALRNGPHVQMTTTFTLSSAEKAMMTNEEAKEKARKMGYLLDHLKEDSMMLLSSDIAWQSSYDLAAVQDALKHTNTISLAELYAGEEELEGVFPAAWPKAAEEAKAEMLTPEPGIKSWGHRHRPHRHSPHSHFPTRAKTDGKMACEGRGFKEWECKSLGCCKWVHGNCYSDVGTAGCKNRETGENVDFRSANEACTWSAPNNDGNYNAATCNAIGCCKMSGSKCISSLSNGDDECNNPLSKSKNVEKGTLSAAVTGSQGGVAPVPASTDHKFSLGVQVPIGDPVKIAAGFGVYFKASKVTAHDALKIAQKIAFGSIIVMPPGVLKKFSMESFELCLAPGGLVEFWLPGESASCGPGMKASLALQVLGVKATFAMEANMDVSKPESGMPISVSIALENLHQLILKVVDAIVNVIGKIIPWNWLLNKIRSFLTFFSIDMFKFGVTFKFGVLSEFMLAAKFKIGSSWKQFELAVKPFETVWDIFKQWGAKLVASVIGFLSFPPFPNGYPCIPFIPGICKETCLFAICAPNWIIDAAIKAVTAAAKAVGKWIMGAAKKVGAFFKGVGGAIGGFVSGAAGAIGGFFGGIFGLKAYTIEEQRVLSHPNATQIVDYILSHGPALNETMDARHMHSLIAHAYDHEEGHMTSAYHVLEPHKNEEITYLQWRMKYVHDMVDHHVNYMSNKLMNNSTVTPTHH